MRKKINSGRIPVVMVHGWDRRWRDDFSRRVGADRRTPAELSGNRRTDKGSTPPRNRQGDFPRRFPSRPATVELNDLGHRERLGSSQFQRHADGILRPKHEDDRGDDVIQLNNLKRSGGRHSRQNWQCGESTKQCARTERPAVRAPQRDVGSPPTRDRAPSARSCRRPACWPRTPTECLGSRRQWRKNE